LNSRLSSFFFLILAIAAGYAGNYFNLPLFFGVDYLFGSIPILMVVCLYGRTWGTIAAAIAGIHTYFLWGHPYAAFILTLEGFFVGTGLHRKQQNLLLLDGFYWVLIGMPLVLLFYGGVLDVQNQTAWLIALKQGTNGIFNALIASLLLTHLPLQRWAFRPKVPKLLSFQQTLFNLLVAFVFFPAFTLLVLHGWSTISNIESTIQANLQRESQNVVTELQLWHQQRVRVLNQLANVAARTQPSSSQELQQSVELLQRTFPTFHYLFVTDKSGKTIASYPPIYNLNLTAWGTLNLRKPITSDIVLAGDDISPPTLIQSLPITRNNNFLGNVISESDLSFITQFLNSLSKEREIEITLVDRNQHVVVSTHADRTPLEVFNKSQGGEIISVNSQVYKWIPIEPSMPLMMRWKNSFYVQQTPASDSLPWTTIVEIPTQSHFKYLQRIYIQSLLLMLLISIVALTFANLISSWLAKPIWKLAQVTTDLPDQLLDHNAIAWPNSQVTEMSVLVDNFKGMVAMLEQKFLEINLAKAELEQRVQERTAELLSTNRELEAEVSERQRVAQKLETALQELKYAQTQLVQTEKMSSLGQLVAGVAHEINNPINFIYGNLIHSKSYIQDLLDLMECCYPSYSDYSPEIQNKIEEIDLEFIKEDLPKIMDSMQVGTERIHEIVRSLRNFSRLDEAEVKAVDIHEGIESTLMILKNRLKITPQRKIIEVIKEYENLPLVECYPGQLNQVFMNILVNAIDALEESLMQQDTVEVSDSDSQPTTPWIQICTKVVAEKWVAIHITDNGIGVTQEQASKLFDPFFTTKPIGKGTGLGLSISYQIIVEKHGGKLYCISQPHQGAEFVIQIPVWQPV
jgi:signal transduction histidine kinase